MTIRIGLLGAGRIGRVHARAITSIDAAALVAVADPVAAAAETISDQYGCDIRSVEAIESAEDVDAVVICTPTDTHADLIERFAKAGKAVFSEKPVDLSIARVRRCLDVVSETNVPFMIGFQRRFDPDFGALKSVIDAGKIGDVEMVTLTSRDPGLPPRDYIRHSGGIFRDMTVHDFDVARWLLGEEVENVQAAATVLVDPEVGKLGDFDSVNVILTTARGKHCIITNTRRASYGYDQRIEVLGSKGAVTAKNRHEANIEVATADGFSRPPLLNFFMTRYIAAYAAEIAAFVEAVASGTPTPTTGEDGLMALALAEAAIRSVEEARVVKLAEILN